ncbi:MAG: HAD family phosphatase [Amylibacter sp.]|nr:HAD family phosphatase [Amylibacter sp.]
MSDTINLVIFDCDGVLLDSEIIACAADAEALRNIGFDITTEQVAMHFAGIPDEAIDLIFEKKLGRPLPENFRADIKRKVLDKYRTELQPIEGAKSLLSVMKTNKCIASSATPAKLALGLVNADLYELVYPHIFSARLVVRGKPHPDIFEYAARVMDVPAERCLVLEDSVAGVTAAKAAGMKCVGFTGGSHCQAGHADRLRDAGAYLVIERLEQMLDIVA